MNEHKYDDHFRIFLKILYDDQFGMEEYYIWEQDQGFWSNVSQ